MLHTPIASEPWKESAMASYDTGTITMNVPQHDILRLSAPDSGHLGAFDHDINFEAGDLLYIYLIFPPLPSYTE